MVRRSQDTMSRFEPMSRLADFKVDRGFTDPRGWKVLDGSGQTLGVARDLIIDTDRMVAAYVDVELDPKIFDSRADRHILVPMRDAERDGDDRRLTVAALTRSRVTALRAARAEHDMQFWERWWRRESAPADPVMASDIDMGSLPATDPRPYGSEAPLEPAPGSHAMPETLRVERRDAAGRERMVAWQPDEPRDRRPIDE